MTEQEVRVTPKSPVSVVVEACGLNTMAAGCGGVVYVEISPNDGLPRLYVWADINDEEPTHVIELEGALESNRKPDKP